MTVVTLGTSQPQWGAPQGPIQGVSVSSQRKGEVDSIKNHVCVCVWVCTRALHWEAVKPNPTLTASTFASSPFRSVSSVIYKCNSCNRTWAAWGSATPPTLQSKEREREREREWKSERGKNMMESWYDCLWPNFCFVMRVIENIFQLCKWATPLIMSWECY